MRFFAFAEPLMPIYEYRCTSCGHQQEFLQKVSDAPVIICTACGKATFAKMLTAAGFQLKGSGWYATDFKSKGSAPAAKTDAAPSGEKAAGEGKTESKAESKTESKTESKAESKTDGAKGSSPASSSGAS
jgi:putative FmdB family regulatory protein